MKQMIDKDFLWNENFKKIEIEQLQDSPVKLISKDWMLVGAGDENKFNALTASWGAVGFIWNRPTLTAYIRDNRYTYEFMHSRENFTVSILEPEFKDAMMICGKQSGRDGNKIASAGLSPVLTPSGEVSYKQARIVVECRKLFLQQMELDNLIPELKDKITGAFYHHDTALHQQFIAQITAVWIKM